MRRTVDPSRQPGYDHDAIFAQVMSQPAREAASSRRRVAGADDRDALPVEQRDIALGDKKRRRILELAEESWVESLVQREEPRAELLDPRDLALRILASPQRRRLAAAAARKVGDRGERGGRRTEARDQLAVGDRADPGRPQQPQAVGEIFDPIRGSVPFLRRRMFSRCFHRTSIAKPSSIGT